MQPLRPVLFRIGAVLLPLVVLLCIELVWQIAAPANLFMQLPGRPEYGIVNPDYATRYFQGFKPQVAFNPFFKDKPADGLRIVALGGSSTAGYPYHFYHAFPERLAAALRARYPLRTVEVINLGMTAVNSHVIRDITPAVIRLDPDAVLIYAGHNEYYGAFGTGTGAAIIRDRAGLKRAVLLLKRSRLFGALEQLIAGGDNTDRTMMARSVGDAHIAVDNPAFGAGVRQFQANLGNTLQHFREKGIPVYIGTVASNSEGQAPLGLDSLAAASYESARKRLSDGDSVAARQLFVWARELDPVRFRAPEAINQSIRNLAVEWDAQLVELESLFSRPGHDTLFTDHLHPTYAGHQIIADAFEEALGEQLSDAGLSPDLDGLPDAFEQAHADLLITRLKGGFPFTHDQTLEQEWTRFAEQLRRAYESGSYADSLAAAFVEMKIRLPEALLVASQTARGEGDSLEALRLMRALLYWQPFNASVQHSALTLAGQLDSHTALAGEVAQLAASFASEVDYLNALAAIRIRQNRFDLASSLLQAIEMRAPDSPVMLFNTARLHVLQGDTLRAQDYFARYRKAVAEASP